MESCAVIDPTSPIFMRGDTIQVPCVFVSWTGHALDEKTPLLRAEQAMSKEGARLLKNLGYNVKGVQSNIGLEQEFFLIPRDSFARRLDLQMTGRTVLGKNAVRCRTCGCLVAVFRLSCVSVVPRSLIYGWVHPLHVHLSTSLLAHKLHHGYSSAVVCTVLET